VTPKSGALAAVTPLPVANWVCALLVGGSASSLLGLIARWQVLSLSALGGVVAKGLERCISVEYRPLGLTAAGLRSADLESIILARQN